MREAVRKCKGVILLFLNDGSPSAFQADWHLSTRRRNSQQKLLSAVSFCYAIVPFCSSKTDKGTREQHQLAVEKLCRSHEQPPCTW